MRISISEAKELIQKALTKYNYTEAEIQKISEIIMYGVLKNSSQGFPKLFGWRIEKDPDAKDFEVERTSPNTVRVNGNRHNSMYVCNSSLEIIKELIQENGIASIGIYNTDNSSGSIGYYTRELAKSGYIGIMFASADPVGGIAPGGSKSGIFGSNPLSISFPFKDSDVTLDMSTAGYTWGDLLRHSETGSQLEHGKAFDKDGNETTDPNEAKSGFVNSFDSGFKGVGLAFMIQLLAGTLSGSLYAQNDTDCDYGNLIIAIDPENFAGRDFIDKEVEKIIKTYKENSNTPLLYPGEHSEKVIKDNLENGTVEIDKKMYNKIIEFIK